MKSVLRREEEGTHREKPCDDGGRDWSEAATSPGPRGPPEEAKRGPSPRACRRTEALPAA